MTDREADQDTLLLNAYLDGELSPSETLEMERRLAADPELRGRADRLSALSGAVRQALLGPPAPAMLRRRIVDTLAFREPDVRRASWMRMAAVLLIGIVAGGAAGTALTSAILTSPGATTTDALLGAHLRALAASQPFDVATSDRHTVKPWFNGKTPLAPQVPDLSADGFVLLGGRIDIVSRRPVPTIVYRRGRHVVDVTIVPSDDAASSGRQSIAGFSIERWQSGDLGYLAIADLPAADLEAFAEAFRRRSAAR
jgi:anti-sigma factor RsiW